MAQYVHKINGVDIAASAAVPGSPLAQALDAISGGAFRIVPLTGEPGDEGRVPDPEHADPPVELSGKIIYLTKDEHSTATDPYTEWIWIEGTGGAADKWEVIGTTSMALDELHANVISADGLNFQVRVVESEGKITEVHVVDDSTETTDNKITSWGTPTDTQYPSAKLVKDSLDTKAEKPGTGQYTEGNIPAFDQDGDLVDSGLSVADSIQGVETAIGTDLVNAQKIAVIPTAAPGNNGAAGNLGLVTIATIEL